MTCTKKNVALYGGSFDPPHLGHVMVVAHLLLNDPSIDEILIVPCFQQTGKQLLDFFPRQKMCRMAFEWLPKTKVSLVEMDLGGESLTVRTMRELKRRNPDWNLRFVMGSDLTTSAPAWEGWEELKVLAPPLIVGRAGITPPEGVGGPTPIAPIVSSTLVRLALGRKDYETARRYLPAAVLEYIQTHKLYTADSSYGVGPDPTGVEGV